MPRRIIFFLLAIVILLQPAGDGLDVLVDARQLCVDIEQSRQDSVNIFSLEAAVHGSMIA